MEEVIGIYSQTSSASAGLTYSDWNTATETKKKILRKLH